MKPTKARVFWDEAAWPWRAAAILVFADLAGLALARFWVGWNIHGQIIHPSYDRHVAAIFGNWSIVTRTLLALVFAGYFIGRGIPARAFGLTVSGFRKRLREFWTCLAVLAPLVAGLTMLSILLLRAARRPDMITPPMEFSEAGDAAKWIWLFVVALPPVEEFTYRGVVHPVLRRHLGAGWAIAVGGLLFGLLHAFYGIDLASLIAYAAGGAALAWVYERTGSLLFPWMLHVATNLVAVWFSCHPG